MLYNVIWGRGVVKNMTFSRYIIYGWPQLRFFSAGFHIYCSQSTTAFSSFWMFLTFQHYFSIVLQYMLLTVLLFCRNICSSLVVLGMWPWPQGSSRTPFGGLGLGLEEKVLVLAMDRGQGRDLSKTWGNFWTFSNRFFNFVSIHNECNSRNKEIEQKDKTKREQIQYTTTNV